MALGARVPRYWLVGWAYGHGTVAALSLSGSGIQQLPDVQD